MSIAKLSKVGSAMCVVCMLVLIVCSIRVVLGIADMNEAAQKRFDSILLAQEVRATSSGLTANARAYVSTGDSTYETAYWNLVKIRSGDMTRPKEAAVSPGLAVPMNTLLVQAGFTAQELALLEESVKISSDLVLIEDQAMNAIKGLFQDASGAYTVKGTPDPELARTLMFGKAYDATVEKIMVPSFKFDALVTERINRQSETVNDSLDLSIIALCVAVAVMAVILIGGVMFLLRSIMRPITGCSAYAQAVAEGDLDASAPSYALPPGNELGRMMDGMQKMVDTLKERIGIAEQKSVEAEEQGRKTSVAMNEALEAQSKAESGRQALLAMAANVEAVVLRLFSSTEQIAARVDESGRSTEQQRLRVAESLKAMGEMNATVLDVARNTGSAARDSDNARTKASEGASVVQQSVSSINVVQQDTDELRAHMEALGQRADAIGTIMTVISDIADQTNLLALNAAIEAARAGEAGRGFAVVADEVRKLAEKTMSATQEVRSAIDGIQTGTRQSVSTVERTVGNLDKAADLVVHSGEALKGIVDDISHTASQISTIAAATEEQSSASEQITGSLEEINRMAEDTSSSMQEAGHAVNDMAQQARELQHLVEALRRQ